MLTGRLHFTYGRNKRDLYVDPAPYYSHESLLTHITREPRSTRLTDAELRKFIITTQKSRKPECLDLGSKLSGSHQLQTILKLLYKDSIIIYINLSHNHITDEDAKQIAEFLQINRTVQTIDLSSNRITERGADLIYDALQDNLFCTYLSLDMNIDDSRIKKISERTQRNREIQQELAKKSIYETATEYLLTKYSIPRGVIDCILDYYNSATILEAQNLTKTLIYQQSAPKATIDRPISSVVRTLPVGQTPGDHDHQQCCKWNFCSLLFSSCRSKP